MTEDDARPRREAARTRLDATGTPSHPRSAQRTRLDPVGTPAASPPWRGTTRLDPPASARPAADPAPALATATPSGFVRRPFPPSLAERLVQEEEIGEGGEAVVYRARYRTGSAESAVVKLFHNAPNYAFDLDDPQYRLHFLPEHTVRILERGAEGGQHWEIAEYCAEGSLQEMVGTTTFSRAELREIARELCTAIASMHPFVHGDIKPSNVLIRTRTPSLDLVLTDFGITIDLAGRSRKTNLGRGTIAYLPPGGRDAFRPENDWWALGMTLLDLVLGRNVFQDEGGHWLDDSRIGEFLATDFVPLDGVSDSRVRLLLSGLLQRNHRQRWSEEQILQWCDGKSPAVAEDRFTVPAARQASALATTDRSTSPFPFGGTAFYVPAELGAALQSSPHAAKVGRGVELSALEEWLRPFECHDRVARVIRQGEKLGAQLTADLVASLIQPEGRPVYRTVDLSSEEQILAAARSFTEGQMKDLYALRPMYYFSSVLDLPALGLLDESWRDLIDQAQKATPLEVRAEVSQDSLRRLALTAVVQGDASHQALATQALTAVSSLPYQGRKVQWFQSVPSPSADTPAVSLAVLTFAPLLSEAAQEIALGEAATLERQRRARIEQLSSRISSLEEEVRRAGPAPVRLSVSAVLGPVFLGGAVAVGMFLVLGLALIVYSIVSISGVVPDGNLVAEFVGRHLFPWAEGALPSGPQEWATTFLSTLYLQMFGLATTITIYIERAATRHFGRSTTSWPSALVLLAMVALVVQPWAIASGGTFPFTTNLDAVFLIPAALNLARTLNCVLWGSRKEQNARNASRTREIASVRQELAGLQGQ